MQRRVELLPSWSILGWLSLTDRPAEDVRLSALSKARLGEFFDSLQVMSASVLPYRNKTYVFLTILINCEVDCTKRPSSNLLLNDILINTVLGSAVVFTGYVLGVCIQ